MKLKYYLKGFGIGIIFATLILSVSFYSKKDKSNPISKQEVERLAAAYGMVYPQETTTVEETEIYTETERMDETKTSEEMRTSGGTKANGETETTIEQVTSLEEENTEEIKETQENTSAAETKKSEEDSNGGSEGVRETEGEEESQEIQSDTLRKEIIITVSSGMYASAIAELLEEMDVIENAEEFSLYLIGEGYTRRLQAGVYVFTNGMDFKTIAGKLLWETE